MRSTLLQLFRLMMEINCLFIIINFNLPCTEAILSICLSHVCFSFPLDGFMRNMVINILMY